MTYLMPTEWEKHAATWIAWPRLKADWPGKFEPIKWVYAEIVRAITLGERAKILVQNAKEKASALEVLKRANINLKKVDFHIVPTDRVWLRDSGPTFVKDGKGMKLLDWKFNAWAKYPNHKLDDKVPSAIAKITGLETIQPEWKGKRVVLEGGAIDVNGKGLLLTTEECLLSKKQERNPGFKREDYESIFEKYLGIKNIIWLGKGIRGDDTHGHVDDITRFVKNDTVVTVIEKNRKDDNHQLLQDNLERLKKTKLNIVELPMPKPVIFEAEQLPASYANFLITNAAVIVPTFGDSNDRVALNILAEVFRDKEIIGINSIDLVWGLGTIHCLSQQEPV